MLSKIRQTLANNNFHLIHKIYNILEIKKFRKLIGKQNMNIQFKYCSIT